MYQMTNHARRALTTRAHLPEEELLRLLEGGYGVPSAMEGCKEHIVVWDGGHGVMPVVDPRSRTVITVLYPDFNCRTGAIATRALALSKARILANDPTVEIWQIWAGGATKDTQVGEYFGPTLGSEDGLCQKAMSDPKIQSLFLQRGQYSPLWLQTYTGRVILLWDTQKVYGGVVDSTQAEIWEKGEPAALAKKVKKLLNKGQPWDVVMTTLKQLVPDSYKRSEILAHI